MKSLRKECEINTKPSRKEYKTNEKYEINVKPMQIPIKYMRPM